MKRYAFLVLAVLAAGAALTVRLCTVEAPSSEGPGALNAGVSGLAGAPIATSDVGPPFDGWCALSVALGRPHAPQDAYIQKHEGLAYHLCGRRSPGGCGALDMWHDCGDLLRADANRQWQLLAQR